MKCISIYLVLYFNKSTASKKMLRAKQNKLTTHKFFVCVRAFYFEGLGAQLIQNSFSSVGQTENARF